MGAFLYLQRRDLRVGEMVRIRLLMTSADFPWLPQSNSTIEFLTTGKLVRREDTGIAVLFMRELSIASPEA